MRFCYGMVSLFLFGLLIVFCEEMRGAPFPDELRMLGLMLGASAGVASGSK